MARFHVFSASVSRRRSHVRSLTDAGEKSTAGCHMSFSDAKIRYNWTSTTHLARTSRDTTATLGKRLKKVWSHLRERLHKTSSWIEQTMKKDEHFFGKPQQKLRRTYARQRWKLCAAHLNIHQQKMRGEVTLRPILSYSQLFRTDIGGSRESRNFGAGAILCHASSSEFTELVTLCKELSQQRQHPVPRGSKEKVACGPVHDVAVVFVNLDMTPSCRVFAESFTACRGRTQHVREDNQPDLEGQEVPNAERIPEAPSEIISPTDPSLLSGGRPPANEDVQA